MTTSRFHKHRALLATPDAKKEDLRGARLLAYFFGSLAITQTFLAGSWAAGILIIPCVLLGAAGRTATTPRGPAFYLFTAIVAAAAEFAVLLSIFIEKVPRFGTLLLGAIISWIAFRSLRLCRELNRLQANPAPLPSSV